MTYYLAIDIGASSGRHLLGYVANGTFFSEEIYRFENTLKKENGCLVWDTETLFCEIKNGMKKCAETGRIPKSVAIDTWGVDYALLNEKNETLFPVFSYRDKRCEAASEKVLALLPQEKLYEITGIQKQAFNTLYQLFCDKQTGKLEKAARFLMMPEYLSFLLTGKTANEYTNASTTNLINAKKKIWDEEILDTVGIKEELFSPPSLPGTELGFLKEEVRTEVGFDCRVLLAPSHDTASAVAAIPIDEESIYISSGTWSLVGTELKEPVLTAAAREANFTNEGGVEYRFRFLKNIMGMWLFQNIRNNLDKKLSYDEMMHLAEQSTFRDTFDPTSPALLAPENMIEAIRWELKMPELPLADVLSSVYHSLALSYKKTVEEIEMICKKKISSIHIVGGGSKDAYLNRLTAEKTGRKVYTGLSEATATGNLLSQWMADENKTLTEARKLVTNSYEIKEVSP